VANNVIPTNEVDKLFPASVKSPDVLILLEAQKPIPRVINK
jgi:hypothetical protein